MNRSHNNSTFVIVFAKANSKLSNYSNAITNLKIKDTEHLKPSTTTL